MPCNNGARRSRTCSVQTGGSKRKESQASPIARKGLGPPRVHNMRSPTPSNSTNTRSSANTSFQEEDFGSRLRQTSCGRVRRVEVASALGRLPRVSMGERNPMPRTHQLITPRFGHDLIESRRGHEPRKDVVCMRSACQRSGHSQPGRGRGGNKHSDLRRAR